MENMDWLDVTTFTSQTPPPRWLVATVDGIKTLLKLPDNWDSYGARPVKSKIAEEALRVLADIIPDDAEPPCVVPMHTGGIQVEWHCFRTGRHLELEFPVHDEPNFFYYEDAPDYATQGDIAGSCKAIRAHLRRFRRDQEVP
jgi:hypothetical protein